MSFSDKVIIVTGASSGIGKALAVAYAKLGASLVLAARRVDKLEDTKSQCIAKLKEVGVDGKVITVETDVSKETDCRKLIETTIEELKQIDVLILNAGMSGGNTPFSTWGNSKHARDVMETNYWGSVYPVFYALPHLRRAKTDRNSRASVVFISSMAGQSGTPLRTAYAPTKFALHGFEQSLRHEEYQYFDITAYCPGYVITELHDDQLKKHGLRRNLSQFITSEECASDIIVAQFNRDRLTLGTPASKLLYYLRPFVPGKIMDRIIAKSSNAAFQLEESKKNA